jgi:hypothetical protein
MKKQEQFLRIVQCGVLAHVKDIDDKLAPGIAMDLMGKAIEAAPRLPAKLSVRSAAAQFIESDGEPDWLK